MSITWDKASAYKWKQLYEDMSKKMNFKNQLHVQELIHKEGVVRQIEVPSPISFKEKQKLKQGFLKALHSCLKERKREGLSLKKDILSQLKAIERFRQKILTLSKKQKAIYRQKLATYAKKDLLLETEKQDIHEELTRIKEHVRHFKTMVGSLQPVGKKLDFYVQEILRELNTIGSKSALPELTLQIVEYKFILEKIKEQIQNVE